MLMSTSSKKNEFIKLKDILNFDLEYFKQTVNDYNNKLDEYGKLNALDMIEIFELISKLVKNEQNTFSNLISENILKGTYHFPISKNYLFREALDIEPTKTLSKNEISTYKKILQEYVIYAEKTVILANEFCNEFINTDIVDKDVFLKEFLCQKKLENLDDTNYYNFFLNYLVEVLSDFIDNQKFGIKICKYCNKFVFPIRQEQESHPKCSSRNRQKNFKANSLTSYYNKKLLEIEIYDNLCITRIKRKELLKSNIGFSKNPNDLTDFDYYKECIIIYNTKIKNKEISLDDGKEIVNDLIKYLDENREY